MFFLHIFARVPILHKMLTVAIANCIGWKGCLPLCRDVRLQLPLSTDQ